MLTNRTGPWLVRLADPAGPGDDLPTGRLSAGRLLRLIELAERHGVLPATVASLQRIAERDGPERIVESGRGELAAGILQRLLEQAKAKLVAANTVCLLLRRQAEELMVALAARRVEAVVLKGPQFADRLYPAPALRTFRDIDILVAHGEMDAAEQAIAQLGYLPKPAAMKYNAAYGEKGFVRPSAVGGAVELHWNLVNSPSLRRGVSVELADLQLEPGPASSGSLMELAPASMLLIAAVHGAASHCFDRLQMLCDVCQAARGVAGEIDAAWLSDAARRTGSSLALTAGLALAEKALDEARCGRLLQRLDLPATTSLWRILLTQGVVLRAHALVDSPRRNLFRQLLKGRR